MSEKPQPTPGHAADLEAIRTAPSFEALTESLANSYDSPLPSLPDEHLYAQLEHHDVLRNATAQLRGEVKEFEHSEWEEINVELEKCIADLSDYRAHNYEEDETFRPLGGSLKGRIRKLFAKETITDKQIEIAMDILEQINTDNAPWTALRSLPANRLPEEPAMRILERGARSAGVLFNERYPSYPSAEYPGFLDAMKHVIGEKYGGPFYWMRDGESIVDDRLKSVVENRHFLPYCIDSAIDEANKEQTPDSRYFVQRSYETYILEDMLGLPEKMATEFEVAFSARTRLRNKAGVVPLDNGGGIDQATWKRQLDKYTANVQKIGVANAQYLRKEWGLVNFDRPSAEQLDRMLRLSDGDELLLEQAKAHEVTLVMLDAIGDTKGSFDGDLYHAENAATHTENGEPTEDIVLFCEINQPSDIYRHMVKLYRRHGIRPSNLFIGTHGLPEGMYFSADIGGPSPGDKNYRDEFKITHEDILQSAASRFFKEYMQPGKESGIRNVLLGACSAMEPRDRRTYEQKLREIETEEDFQAYHGQNYRNSHEPLGEALARIAGQDARTQVYGVDESFRLEPIHVLRDHNDIMVPYTSTKAVGRKRLAVRSYRADKKGTRSNVHLQGFPFNKTERKQIIS